MDPQIRLRIRPIIWETKCEDGDRTIFAGIGYEKGTIAERQKIAILESLNLWRWSNHVPYSAVMLLPMGWGPNFEESPPDPFWRDVVQLADELNVRLDRTTDVW